MLVRAHSPKSGVETSVRIHKKFPSGSPVVRWPRMVARTGFRAFRAPGKGRARFESCSVELIERPGPAKCAKLRRIAFRSFSRCRRRPLPVFAGPGATWRSRGHGCHNFAVSGATCRLDLPKAALTAKRPSEGACPDVGHGTAKLRACAHTLPLVAPELLQCRLASR